MINKKLQKGDETDFWILILDTGLAMLDPARQAGNFVALIIAHKTGKVQPGQQNFFPQLTADYADLFEQEDAEREFQDARYWMLDSSGLPSRRLNPSTIDHRPSTIDHRPSACPARLD